MRRGPARAGARKLPFAVGVGVLAVAALAFHPWDGVLGFAAGAGIRGGSGAPNDAPGGVTAASKASAAQSPRSDRAGDLQASPGPALLAGYQWPTRDARITNGYGSGRPGSFVLDGKTFHDGIDLASFCGATITAAHAGTVLVAGRHNEAFIGWVGDLAPMRAKLDAEDKWGTQAIMVVIDDGNGYRSIYAHLGVASVKAGDVVKAGDLIGYEGASGNATGCHLHYALFDPLETATLTLDPKLAAKSKLPRLEIARIDPLRVMPPPAEAGLTWGWGAH